MTLQYSILLLELNLQRLVSAVDKIIAGTQVNILPFIRATLTFTKIDIGHYHQL